MIETDLSGLQPPGFACMPKGKVGLSTPQGQVTQLPLQVMLRLDWLVGRDEARTLA